MSFPSWLPLGLAIRDYHERGSAPHLMVHTKEGSQTPYVVEMFFRTYDDFGVFDELGCAMAYGRVLDVGAGAGCISLFLQEEMDVEVTAIEIAPDAVDVMRKRGILDARAGDFFSLTGEKWDTILLMMNGIGFVGSLEGYGRFLDHAKKLLNPGGQILFDSSDLELSPDITPSDFQGESSQYYGEVWYQLSYQGLKGEPYLWLYLDSATAKKEAAKHGYDFELVEEAVEGYYFARLTLKGDSLAKQKRVQL